MLIINLQHLPSDGNPNLYNFQENCTILPHSAGTFPAGFPLLFPPGAHQESHPCIHKGYPPEAYRLSHNYDSFAAQIHSFHFPWKLFLPLPLQAPDQRPETVLLRPRLLSVLQTNLTSCLPEKCRNLRSPKTLASLPAE